MITWGISANSHDAALAVFKHGHKGLTNKKDFKLLYASHSERYSKIKNDAHLNKELIDYARQYGEPDEVVWYERPLVKTFRQFRAGQGFNFRENNVRDYLAGYGIRAPIKYTDHHLSHAAAGYYTSGFTEACVVCIDSIGEFDTLTIWHGRGKNLKAIYKQKYPHSVGLWYSAITQRVGLKPQEDEYILMGMAAYGDPDRLYHDIKSDFVQVHNPDEWFNYNPLIEFKQNLHRGCMDWRPDLTTEQDYFDVAAGAQYVYEDILRWVLGYARRICDTDNLVLMGGCALNCSANSIAYDYFKNIWIMPNPGDAGSAIGCVLAHYKTHIKFPGAYLGHEIKGEYPVEKIVDELLRTGIAGVANGKSEFGPRALGNRSLLGDPRGPDIKHRVNEIKRRQQFRPFAPAILAEHAGDYFDGATGPYMQYTARCKQPEQYPAIIHGDGTSRVQTVDRGDTTGFRKLLERWYEVTGCPMLLNTSLNIKGQPIVNDEADAIAFEERYGVKVFTC